MAWAQYSRNKGYGRIASTVGTSDTAKLNLKSATNVEAFYKNVKEAIISGYLVISPSTIVYNIAGHFWVIVGYATGKTTDASILYMRNVALSAPSSCPDCLKYGYDTTTTVGEFFRKSANGQMLIVK